MFQARGTACVMALRRTVLGVSEEQQGDRWAWNEVRESGAEGNGITQESLPSHHGGTPQLDSLGIRL